MVFYFVANDDDDDDDDEMTLFQIVKQLAN